MFGEPRNAVEKEINMLSDLPPEEVTNYEMKKLDGSSISFKELFGDKDELILVHNMGPSCPYCTLWADGFKGYVPYLNDRCAFWMETDKDPNGLNEFVKERDWNFNVVSTEGSSLKKDFGFQTEKDGKTFDLPGFSTLYLEGDKIFRHATAPFGPGDDYCLVWPMLSRLKKSTNDWQPGFNK
jgi:predicted dithiol-disulfide oxidoreductase (DUF899 family)